MRYVVVITDGRTVRFVRPNARSSDRRVVCYARFRPGLLFSKPEAVCMCSFLNGYWNGRAFAEMLPVQ